MNEASVSGAWMTALRKRRPLAEVIKHRDAGMIGLPDCSVTDQGRVLWVEFKLLDYKGWVEDSIDDLTFGWAFVEAQEKASKAQLHKVRDLDRAARAFYLAWVKKTCVYAVSACGNVWVRMKDTKAAVDFADAMLSTGQCPLPRIEDVIPK